MVQTPDGKELPHLSSGARRGEDNKKRAKKETPKEAKAKKEPAKPRNPSEPKKKTPNVKTA